MTEPTELTCISTKSELRAWTSGELDKIVTKTDKYWIEYSDGNRLLDLQSGNSAYTLGYGNREIMDALASEVNFIRGNKGETCELSKKMVNLVCSTGNWDVLSWAISGSSAVESAIKMNDQYWGNQENFIVTFVPGFHGTTYLTRNMGDTSDGIKRIKKVPTPLWRKQKDQESAEDKAIKYLKLLIKSYNCCGRKIGCIVMETLPWLKGGIPWSPRWWRTIRDLCNENDILMITDDVCTCWGKGGGYHGWQKYGVQPDISALGKSLTAGYTPLGCSVANKKVGDVLKEQDWEFGHTWQPTMTGISAMNAVNNIIVRDNLFELCKPIEDSLRFFAEDCLDRKYITGYRVSDLFLSLDVKEELNPEALIQSGLALSKTRNKSIRIVANFLADGEFFDEMQRRLFNFFSINNTEG
tara:strand:- start:895 stop:2130 length:1236 start_codon:yes stop_codon:yes gene_type:complete